ncbi:MAG: type II secretion system protein [Planctomycetes bacterium]|nr:type II secretion system protein [Planctomycetota bacterium]
MNRNNLQVRIRPRRGGFSYIEVIISAVIISVLLVAALRLFGILGRSQAAANEMEIAAHLAVELIEEITESNYADRSNTNVFGPEPAQVGPDRTLYDDVDDYHNWSANPPLDHFGQPYTQYGDFTRSVQVQYIKAADFSLTTVADEGFKQVVVTVSRNGRELTRQTYIIADTDNP